MAVLRSFLLAVLFLLAGCAGGGETLSSPTPPALIATTPVTPAIPTITPSPPAAAAPTAAPSQTPVPATPAAASTPTAAPSPPPGPLSDAALVEALRGGGYVIYFRHAATDPQPDDAVPVNLEDCSTQRMLSAAGQEQARLIGQAFQRLEIPVGQVLASPFCRALDTARLAFGEVQAEPALENLETSPDDAERERRTAGLRRLLSTPPDPGANTILAAHGFNISAAAQVSISEGEAAVFRPEGQGSFSLVATIEVDEWAALEQSLSGQAAPTPTAAR